MTDIRRRRRERDRRYRERKKNEPNEIAALQRRVSYLLNIVELTTASTA